MTAKRTDSNQNEIVKVFRQLGCSVWITSDLGKGAPDCVVGMVSESGHPFNLLVEIKDGKKAPSQQRLTEAEQKFHDEWVGQIAIIRSVEQVIDLFNRYRYAGIA